MQNNSKVNFTTTPRLLNTRWKIVEKNKTIIKTCLKAVTMEVLISPKIFGLTKTIIKLKVSALIEASTPINE